MRVKKSAMGSVCIVSPAPLTAATLLLCRRLRRRLPACFHDAGDFALERHTAEANSAHLELANISAGATANAAAIAYAHLEFRLLMRLCDFCQACHLLRSSRNAQGNSETLQKLPAFLVVLCRGRQGDVHALDFVHAGVVDFRKHQLVSQAHGVVAAPV